jgi:hypothetical protein
MFLVLFKIDPCSVAVHEKSVCDGIISAIERQQFCTPQMTKGEPLVLLIGWLLCVHVTVIGRLYSAGSDVEEALHVIVMLLCSVVLGG